MLTEIVFNLVVFYWNWYGITVVIFSLFENVVAVLYCCCFCVVVVV